MSRLTRYDGTKSAYRYYACPVCEKDEAVEVVVRATPGVGGVDFEEEILTECCPLSETQQRDLQNRGMGKHAMTCFHECDRCRSLFSHVPDCGGKYCAPEFGLCATCLSDGYQLAWCPKCSDTKPINAKEFLCDDCLKPNLRTA